MRRLRNARRHARARATGDPRNAASRLCVRASLGVSLARHPAQGRSEDRATVRPRIRVQYTVDTRDTLRHAHTRYVTRPARARIERE